jgi:hypothetical protein
MTTEEKRLECKICSFETSLYWREIGLNIFVCNSCFINKLYLKLYKNNEKKEEDRSAIIIKPSSSTKINNKKRSVRLNLKRLNKQNEDDDNNSVTSSSATNTTNRRSSIFKKIKPKKQDLTSCSVNTSEFVFHRGLYLQIDDIVSLFDGQDVYYAQIRGFLTDQYASKSAILTWLLPTNLAQSNVFDENAFVLGPDEEFPRSLDCMKFVCRPKQSYFKHKHLLYDTSSTSSSFSNCYLKDVKINCLNFYYNLSSNEKFYSFV